MLVGQESQQAVGWASQHRRRASNRPSGKRRESRSLNDTGGNVKVYSEEGELENQTAGSGRNASITLGTNKMLRVKTTGRRETQ